MAPRSLPPRDERHWGLSPFQWSYATAKHSDFVAITFAMVKGFILANPLIPPNGNVCPSIRQVLAARGALVLVGIQCLNHVCRFIITVNFFPYSSQRLTFVGTLFRGRGRSPAEILSSSARWRHRHCASCCRPLRPCARAVVMGRQGTAAGVGFQGDMGF
jgi:hypothetical protein